MSRITGRSRTSYMQLVLNWPCHIEQIAVSNQILTKIRVTPLWL